MDASTPADAPWYQTLGSTLGGLTSAGLSAYKDITGKSTPKTSAAVGALTPTAAPAPATGTNWAMWIAGGAAGLALLLVGFLLMRRGK